MKEKYLVEINLPGEETKMATFKTRQEIVEEYNIPLYIVDKIIKISNDLTFQTKRKSHRIFRELVETMKIYLILPKLYN